ncbi:uncharacterized protein LOC131254131 [Magnolia sinica]|uniref:uncharacterized protein LOC131254131 n=1 Tax=Magnolia sinica TaxID=86752 RepID=UPI002658B98C|nr:uncharacterized protein LOC131254131 [Magnolia sinica]
MTHGGEFELALSLCGRVVYGGGALTYEVPASGEAQGFSGIQHQFDGNEDHPICYSSKAEVQADRLDLSVDLSPFFKLADIDFDRNTAVGMKGHSQTAKLLDRMKQNKKRKGNVRGLQSARRISTSKLFSARGCVGPDLFHFCLCQLCSRISRRELWAKLASMSTSVNGIWAIGGDFNVVSDASERSRRLLDRASSIDFFDAINNVGLMDAGFSGNRFTWSNNQVCQADRELGELKASIQNVNPSDDPSLQQLNDIKLAADKLNRLELMQEIYWKQKARIDWLVEGDRNIKFFHASAVAKHRHSRIHKVISESGHEIKDIDGIKAEAVNFFTRQFTSSPTSDAYWILQVIPHIVSQQQNHGLMASPTLMEVKKPVEVIPMDAAPGPEVRLSSILPSITSLEQGAFIPGRLISENIVLSQELFRDIARKVLSRFGFGTIWVDLVENCGSNNWFLVLVNGESTSFFKSTRGLQQGDPISPALFVIMVEALNWGLRSLVDQCRCIPFKTCRGCPRVSHLLYADDTLLFLNGGVASLWIMRDFLDKYQDASGQSINLYKSYFVCAPKMTSARVRANEEVLGIARASSTFSYLGVPISAGRVKASMFQPLLDKINGRIQGWQARILSQASRMVLIKHVWGSVPIHLLVAAHIPQQGKGKLHWMNWKRLAVPMEEGGLGFRRLQEIMQAFRLKMVWSIVYAKNDSLWGSFMSAKYKPPLQHLDSHRRCSYASPIWSRIQSQFSLLATIVQHRLGEGTCLLWSENWSGLGSLTDLAVNPIPEAMMEMQVRDFLGPCSPLPPSTAFNFLPQRIIDYSFQGGFSVSVGPNSTFWPVESFRILWSKWLPPKISLLAWRILQRAVPVDVAVQSRGVQLASACVCCGFKIPGQISVETIPHLFLHSRIAKALWHHIGEIFHINILSAPSLNLRIAQWNSAFLASMRKSEMQRLAPFLLCWVVWKARNAARFDNKKV